MAPSTCSRLETDNQATRVKLLIGVALFVVTVTKALQPPLDVLSWNTKLLFSGTNSMVSAVQNNELFLLHGVLASNGLDSSVSGCATLYQQFRCRLKLIPKPKDAYIGVTPILETLWYCLRYTITIMIVT